MSPREPATARTWLALLSALALFTHFQLVAQPVSEEAVKEHIERLKRNLIRQQQGDGSWQEYRYRTGLTALVIFALKHAGLPDNHPALQNGLNYILQNSDQKTYSESLVICALELMDPGAHRRRIEQALNFLIRTQIQDGGWSYDAGRGSFDNSNSQFAVLGLAAAERCGFEIPPAVKRRALDHWLRSKTSDGGWPYRAGGDSYLSMTCAGIASLQLLGREHEKPTRRCGVYEYDTTIEKGLKALLKMMSRPDQSTMGWRGSYTLYALERVGMFLDMKELEGLDWYRWGAARILANQGSKDMSDLAFDLLFLAKGEAQVAISKWRWSGDWNNDHQDVKNWVAQAGKELKMKLDWLPASLDRRDTPAARSSLIFVNGHGSFQATDQEASILREFLAGRGTVVAEGCCQSKTFQESFKKFVSSRLFPNLPIDFVPIPPGHPVCRQTYSLLPEDVSALQVKTGCHRRRILLLTRDISCALGGEPTADAGERERAKKVSINLLQWAMRSKVPRGKLARVALSNLDENTGGLLNDELSFNPAGASRKLRQPFGRLIHRGEWDVDLALFPTLAAAIRGEDTVPRFDGEVFVNPTSRDLFSCAVLFLTGHGDPGLKEAEWLPLRLYLQNGGIIIATACCGFEEFDAGFRGLMRLVLPNDRLEEIPRDSAIWSSPISLGATSLATTTAFRKRYGEVLAPLYGIRREGRWIVLYSPVDLCCDLEGDLDEDTIAYKKGTSVPIWINLLSYLFTP